MAKSLGMLFGLVFLAVGILGFVPGISPPGPDGMPMLLGIFMVNTAHSIVHIDSGAVFLIASMCPSTRESISLAIASSASIASFAYGWASRCAARYFRSS